MCTSRKEAKESWEICTFHESKDKTKKIWEMSYVIHRLKQRNTNDGSIMSLPSEKQRHTWDGRPESKEIFQKVHS